MDRFLTKKRVASTNSAELGAGVGKNVAQVAKPECFSPVSTPASAGENMQQQVKSETNLGGFSRNVNLEKIRKLSLDEGVLAQIERFAEAYPEATEDMVNIIVNIARRKQANTSGSTSLQTPSTSVKMERALSTTAAHSSPTSEKPFPSADAAGGVLPQVMCLYPRGKHDVEVHESRIFFRAKNLIANSEAKFIRLDAKSVHHVLNKPLSRLFV